MQCKTIAVYIRLSVEDGDLDVQDKFESNSVANQRMLLMEFIESKPELKGYKITEFCDDGFTGTNFERPGFQEMMAQVKMKQIHCIIVKDLSRFGREYLDVSSYLELILPIFDVRFISVNDRFDSNDYVGTTGGMELAFRNLINGMYSKDISIKVKSAKKTKARRGEYLGGHPFYGYLKDPKNRHHLIVDEEVRPVIEHIFEMCIQGMSTMQIAKTLNEEGILCPVEYKKSRGISYSKMLIEDKAIWIQCTVRKIIKDERYTGMMVSNVRSSAEVGKNVIKNNRREEWIIVENTHDAIISKEVFQAANAALASRIKTTNYNTNWKKSGNLFVCGCCGRKLQKSYGKEPYLYCLKSRYEDSAECAAIGEDIQNIEKVVLETIRKMGQALANGIMIKKRKNKDDISALNKRLESIQKQLQRNKIEKRTMYEEYKSGRLSKEEFMAAQSTHQDKAESLEEMRAQCETDILERKCQIDAMKLVEDELRSADSLVKYDPIAIGQIVEKIIVYPGGRIELVMKNQDSYENLLQLNNDLSA